MAARREITKKFARLYAKADKAEKGPVARCTGRNQRVGQRSRPPGDPARPHVVPIHVQQRRPWPRKYSYDALLMLQEVWRLSGQPCGKYLVSIMADTLERLGRFNELGKVAQNSSP